MECAPTERLRRNEIEETAAIELAALQSMSRDELRVAWVRRTKASPPNLSASLLRLALAHAIQTKALGGITKSMDRKLRELAAGRLGQSLARASPERGRAKCTL